MLEFDEFFAAEYGRVVRSLALALGDRARAEDGAQVAFASAFRRWRRVGSMDRPAGWVYVVALRDARRRLRRDQDRSDVIVGNEIDRTDGLLDHLSVLEALAVLTPRQRLAVVLRYYADLRVDDIAIAMGCAPGTVKATLNAALGRLRVQLANDEEEVASAN